MLPEWINTIGLVANIIGVVIAFFYGYPQPSHEEGVSLGLELGTPLSDGKTVAQHNEDVRRQRRKYLICSRLGLLLMGLGFVLQLVATWIARSTA
jgi:hypothetical protein